MSEATRCVTCVTSAVSQLSSGGEVFKQFSKYHFENFPFIWPQKGDLIGDQFTK